MTLPLFLQHRPGNILHPASPGYALMEHMGGLLFYLTMGAAAAIVLTIMFSDSKLSEMQQSLTSIRLKANQVFTGSGSYNGLDNAFAIKAGIIPTKMVRGTTIRSPWGKELTIAPSGDSSAFVITLDGVPEKDCVGLSSYQVDTWEAISVNGNTVTRDTSLTTASASCSGANNTLTYTAR